MNQTYDFVYDDPIAGFYVRRKTQPSNSRKEPAMTVKTLQPFVYRDPDNDDQESRWCLFAMAPGEDKAQELAIAEIAKRMGRDEGDTDYLPPELGGQIIRQIVSGDAEDTDAEFSSGGYAVLLVIKAVPEE